MVKTSKKRILFVVTLPPPVHGMSMVNYQIQQSSRVKSEFECQFVNLSASRTLGEIGKGGLCSIIRKGMRVAGSLFGTLYELIFFRPDVCYLTITCHGKAFLKDFPFVILCKLFCRRIVIHQHNRGMSAYVHRLPYQWLLPLVYRNTIVVLLSWALYDDISEIVRREQVRICPNGI